MGSKGSKNVQTNTAEHYKAHPLIEHGAEGAINRAMSLSQQPYIAPTRQIAGFTQDQAAGFGQIRDINGIGDPYYDEARDYTRQGAQAINPEDLQTDALLNPYAAYALQALNQDIGTSNRNLRGNLVKSAGGVGADRIGVAEGQKFRQDQLARGQLMGGYYSDALSKALGLANSNRDAATRGGYQMAGLGQQRSQAGYADANALIQSGTLQQGLQQSQLDSEYAAALANLDAPWKQNQYLTSTVQGLAPALGGSKTGSKSETTTTQQDPLQTALGVGMMGAGLMTGNPMMMKGGMSGLGGMTGMGNPNIPGFSMGPQGQTGGNFLGMSQSMPWWARGGRVNRYALGGAVNPWDFAEGYDEGGSAFDLMPSEYREEFADRLRDSGRQKMDDWNGNYQNIHGPSPYSDPDEELSIPPARPSNPFSLMPAVAERRPQMPSSAMSFDAPGPDAPSAQPQQRFAAPARSKASIYDMATEVLQDQMSSPPPNLRVPDFVRRQREPREWGGFDGRLMELGARLLAATGDRDRNGVPTGTAAGIGNAFTGTMDNERKLREEFRKDTDDEMSDEKRRFDAQLGNQKLIEDHGNRRMTAANTAITRQFTHDQRTATIDERIRSNMEREGNILLRANQKYETDLARLDQKARTDLEKLRQMDEKIALANRAHEVRERQGDWRLNQGEDRNILLSERNKLLQGGTWSTKPGTQADKDGNVVEGTWYLNNRDPSKSIFKPGDKITSASGQAQAARLVILNDLKREAFEKTGVQLSTEDALSIMRRPGVDSVHIRGLETIAAANARARLSSDQKAAEARGQRLPPNHFTKILGEERARHKLPGSEAPAPNSPAATAPDAPKTADPYVGPDGSINEAGKKFLKSRPVSPGDKWFTDRSLNPRDYDFYWQ